MKTYFLLILGIVTGFLVSCQSSSNSDKNSSTQDSLVLGEESKVLAIDILLDPDQNMLDRSKEYNDRMRINYPEGFELDESHRPHITVIQAFVREGDLSKIEDEIRKIISANSLQGQNLLANGMYYIPYDGKGLAGITVEKGPLMNFHQQIVSMMEA